MTGSLPPRGPSHRGGRAARGDTATRWPLGEGTLCRPPLLQVSSVGINPHPVLFLKGDFSRRGVFF